MKKIIKIFSAAFALAIVAIIVVSFGQPVREVMASHSFPEKLDDWSEHDWDKFYEYLEEQWEKENRYCYGTYPPYYNPYYNYNYGGAIIQPNNNVFNNYNYYNGLIDVYDANTEGQAQILAKIIHLYGHGVASQTQQACIGWSVINSVDGSGAGADIGTVAGNFHYNSGESTTDDFGRDLMPLARDLIFRWKAGRAGISNNGRVLPGGYCWVWSTGTEVYFRNVPNESGTVWNYNCQTPYGS